MVAIPDKPEMALVEMIYQGRERREAEKRKGWGVYLARLSASSLGGSCPRQAFLEWRAYARKTFSGRILRLFETGHIQEARVVEDLRLAGLKVWDIDPETKKQFTYVDPETGHFVDKIDGVVRGVPGAEKTAHLLEIKTHNDKRYAAVVKHGVQQAEPGHYFQCQAGMWLAKLDRALYLAVNKNDEAIYPERIRRDKDFIEKNVKGRIRTLVDATLIPAGISVTATAFDCTHCDQKAPCLGAVPLKNCRTCKHCEPGSGGSWLCHLWQKELSWDEQRAACDEWKPLIAEPIK